MKKISDLFDRIFGSFLISNKAHFRSMMNSHLPRTKDNFIKEFESNTVARVIAEKTYETLLSKWCPLDKNEFVPHLLDEVDEDYGIIHLDLQDFLFGLLEDYDLPKKNIRGSDREIITVRDLIEFAVAVTRNYPLKSAGASNTKNS
jgi:hypothetical protein